jgi:hypothetical protein
MNQTCKQCASPFEIAPEDLVFYDSISPVLAGQKMSVPAPKLCPLCRLQQRMAFRNERKLYSRKSDFSGRVIITNYSPDKPYKVYDQDEWWGDQWEGTNYGRDFDFNRTFTEQFNELMHEVPHISLINTGCENSYYTNFALFAKNCYLIFGSGNSEDCLYGKYIVSDKNCIDNLALYNSELCYEGVASENCYQCQHFSHSRNCVDCLMIDNCLSCKNCIGCFGLVNKEYCTFNQYVGKEKFAELKAALYPLTTAKIAALRQQFEDLKRGLPHRESRIYASENCSGDNIYNSKNCAVSYDIKECEDSKYLNFSPKTKNSYDIIFCAPDGMQFSNSMTSSVGTRCMAGYLVWYCDSVYYSEECHHSNDLFGCVGLKNKKYCLLNKQYTKEEYESLAARVIEHMRKTGEWGEFLDYQIAPFGYNETVAQEYYPLDVSGASAIGAKWHEAPVEKLEGALVSSVPETITEVADDILNQVLTCEVTGRPYKIIAPELKFYREQKIPLPRRHPDQRHLERVAIHTPYRLFDRSCAQCGKAIQTAYSTEKVPVVYCEACYLKATY